MQFTFLKRAASYASPAATSLSHHRRCIHIWDKLPGESYFKESAKAVAPPVDLSTTKRDHFDVVIVGGGIVGLATAREIIKRDPSKTVVVLEKEREVAAHQSGHNSGVIHAGLYYLPGSNIADTCVHGNDLMYKYCEENNIPHDRCGKLVVAADKKEHSHVERLFEQGSANGVKGLEILYGEKITQMEPNIVGYSALWSPNTGIVDYGLVCRNMAKEIIQSGRGEIRLAFEVRKFEHQKDGRVQVFGTEPTLDGPIINVTGKNVITCAGFYADRVATLAGGDPNLAKVVAFRGSYLQLKPQFRGVVRTNIYPVPSTGGIPVGVHFTPTVNARRGMQMIVGPGACIAFSREGYRFSDFNLRDVYESLTNLNFWSYAFKNMSLSVGELYRDLNQKAFLKCAQKLMPSLTADMVENSFAGVMSQVFDKRGIAVSDYILERKVLRGTTMNVRNAPSPASTGSLAIAEMIVDVANKDFDWKLPYSGSKAAAKMLKDSK